jgi:hypothetical protein
MIDYMHANAATRVIDQRQNQRDRASDNSGPPEGVVSDD